MVREPKREAAQEAFRFMTVNQAEHSVTVMAEFFGVSVSGFYAVQKWLPSGCPPAASNEMKN